MEEVDDAQPFYAVVVDSRAVSACRTVRRSMRGMEAGVKTLEDYRRRGYAKRAVAGWCRAAREDQGLGSSSKPSDERRFVSADEAALITCL